MKFSLILQGQILANLTAMDSDYFAKNTMGRQSKVRDNTVNTGMKLNNGTAKLIKIYG